MGLVSRLLRRRDGIALSARPDPVRLARRTGRIRCVSGLRPHRPFDHAVSAGRGLSRDLVRPTLRPLARLRTLLRRPLLWPLHLRLAGRTAGHVAVGRPGRVVGSVFRVAGTRAADGVAVLARHREMGTALGAYCRATAPGCRTGAGRWLTPPRRPSLRSWQSTAPRARLTVENKLREPLQCMIC